MSAPEGSADPIGVQWANFYRHHRLNVIPAIAGQKRPGLESWEDLQHELAPQPVYDRWFGPFGARRNIQALGIIPIKGQFIIDLDLKPERNGLTWWQSFIETHLNGIDPETWEGITGGGGRHKWFQAPDGWIPPTTKFPAIGVDVRGQGGYVVVPPTLHANGQYYRWAEGRRPGDCDLAPAPPELIAEIDRLRAAQPGSGQSHGARGTGAGASYDAFGVKDDGREQDFADTAWAICVDHYRDLIRAGVPDPLEPDLDTLRDEIDLAYDRFLARVKARADDPPGATEEERLGKRGYSRESLRAKVVYALRKWRTKVREDAMRGDPDDPPPGGEQTRSESNDPESDFDFGPHAEARQEPPDPDDDFVSVADLLAGTRPGPREFLVGGVIPTGQVTELRGDGKVGKSRLAIQLCASVATGRNWLGMRVHKRGPVIYLAAEDDRPEIFRRFEEVAAGADYQLTNDDLRDVYVWALANKGDPALFVPPAKLNGKLPLAPTERWVRLAAKAEEIKPALIVLDSRADVFAGNEIDRLQVRTFVNQLRTLAIRTGAGLMVLAHPSLTGMANGTHNSGSTHWTNAVRSVLIMKRPEPDEDTGRPDPLLRLLEFGPQNYGPDVFDPIKLRWRAGVYEVEADQGRRSSQSRSDRDAEIEMLFLDLLREFTLRGDFVRPGVGRSGAGQLFAGTPQARAAGANKAALMAAQGRLKNAGRIDYVADGRRDRDGLIIIAVRPAAE